MLNIAAVVGETVTFTCKYNITINPRLPWMFYKPREKNGKIISMHNVTTTAFTGRFKTDIDTKNGLSKLSITDVQTEDGGMYECQRLSEDGSMTPLSADFTVLGETDVFFSN
jgi:uncharacterized protein YodC (DUF2158 family)